MKHDPLLPHVGIWWEGNAQTIEGSERSIPDLKLLFLKIFFEWIISSSVCTLLLCLIYLIVVLFMHLFDWLFAMFVVHCLCMWGSLDDRSFLPNVVYLERAKSPYFWGKGISLATSQISLFKNVIWVDLQFLYPLHDYIHELFRWFTFPSFRFLFFIF